MASQARRSQEYSDDESVLISDNASPRQSNHIPMIMAAMHGRLVWASLLAVVLGIGGGVAGYLSQKPVYRSSVPIRVVPILPRVLYDDEEKGVLPRYESFVETQVALIKSQRVVDLAMQDPKWLAVDKDNSTQAVISFLDSLTVARKNELISVFFNHENPNVAMIGAQAVVEAYRKLYLEADAKSETRRLEILQQLLTANNNDLESRKQRLASISDEFTGQDIGKLYDAKFDEIRKYQSSQSELEVQLALVEASTRPDAPPKLAADELAAFDPTLASIRERRSLAQHRLNSLQQRGLGKDHPEFASAQSSLDYESEKVRERLEFLKKFPPQLKSAIGQVAMMSGDPQVLKAQIAKVAEMSAKAQAEYQRLGRANLQTTELRDQVAAISRKIEETQQRIDQLNVESSMSGRISVLSEAERPLAPFTDARTKLAAAGGIGGLVAGFGIVLALSLADRRLRNVRELQTRLSINHILGVLPTLPKNLSDPDQAALASHAVHHIRSMIQIRLNVAKPALVLTSPVSGTGKTSLTLALGVSFASTGMKTLLIDCDMIAGGLTRRVNAIARRRIGQLLCRERVITAKELQHAVAVAKRDKQKLGEVVVRLGFASQEEVDRCLAAQSETSLGVMEALAGERVVGCVAFSGVSNMWILPLGEATAHHAGSLSPAAMQRMIESAKEQFDVVLIDTGPIPGSLEASVVASAADGVVMLLSRGEPRPVAEACLKHLEAIGANLTGVVFNRVNASDMPIYATSRSLSTSSASQAGGARASAVLARIDRSADFGPVARAVVSAAPMGKSR